MHIELTTNETDYLRTILEAARKELTHEIHHAHKQDFKESLKRQLELNEKVDQKLGLVLQHV
jgi:mevalonate kinase